METGVALHDSQTRSEYQYSDIKKLLWLPLVHLNNLSAVICCYGY